MKPKLADAGIENTVEYKYMTFTTTPTANTLKIMVSLEDEKRHLKSLMRGFKNRIMFNPKQFHDFKF